MKKYTFITVTQTFKERFLVNIGEDSDIVKINSIRDYSEDRDVIIFDTTNEIASDKETHLLTQLHWFAGMDSFPVTMNQTTLSDFLFSANEGGNRVGTSNRMEHTINIRDSIFPDDYYFYTYALTIDEFLQKAGDLNFSYYVNKLEEIKKNHSVFVTFGITQELDSLKAHEKYSEMQIINSFYPFETFLKETGILPYHFAPVPLIRYSILCCEILKYMLVV